MTHSTKGFTLIELMVVVTVITLMFTATLGILLNTFRSSNRLQNSAAVDQQGAWMLSQMRGLLLQADPNSLVCNGNSISFDSKYDGGNTTFNCILGSPAQIASSSALASGTTNYLYTTSDIVPVSCGNFVTCQNASETGGTAIVNVEITLARGNVSGFVDQYAQRKFSTQVTLRN